MPGRTSLFWRAFAPVAGSAVAAVIVCAAAPVRADTLREVLSEVFARNPTVNAARQTVRSTRETITQAEAGYRPVVNFESWKTGTRERQAPPVVIENRSISSNALTITQPIFDGFKARNSVRQAAANHEGAIDGLRNTTQNTLQTAVQAYVDILRDTAILDLRQKDLGVLTEQVRVTRAQLAAGDVRPSDVSQTEARQAASRAAMSLAQSNLRASQANFMQVVGRPAGRLAEAPPVDRMIPPTLDEVLGIAYGAHPAIRSARAIVEAAEAQIHINRADLLPKVALEGLLQDQYNTGIGTNLVTRDTVGQVLGRVTVPIYEGGLHRARVREATEILEQRRFELEAVRALVRATASTAWAALIAARAQIEASSAQIKAAQAALDAVLAEARGGIRTQLETLNARKELLDARVALVAAKHDRVLASYVLLASAGLLDPLVPDSGHEWHATTEKH